MKWINKGLTWKKTQNGGGKFFMTKMEKSGTKKCLKKNFF